ncbi:hypothetical protein HRI_003990000 [Hibiscus trionum]|uniref:RRM domain-containing protein n=1 Tax=Hibiscus trionum TaxID=183268 RepID=A0A9W7IYI2_HIBTR|nr:hypothetical protein HRI_003990000 [Hibiscus trionum]
MRREWSERSAKAAGENKVRRRLGVSIFVDNVSRRIHPKTLKEAFLEYGSMVDVYMAYRNQRKRNKPTVFAFVRFSKKEEAELAILKGNGRIMDGFKVRIFLAQQKMSENTRVRNHGRVELRRATFRDNRTFKDVLLGVPESVIPSGDERGVEDRTEDGAADIYKAEGSNKVVRVVLVESDQEIRNVEEGQQFITIQKKEMAWIKNCMVGRIKTMYNAEIVQEALRSDGFQVTVCPWFGLLVILRAPDAETKNEVWALRGELLRTWFDKLELLVGYEG